MFEHHVDGGEAKAVGWISMSDMFMLCSIVMLGVAVSFAVLLRRTDQHLTSVQGEYASYKNSNTQTIDELNAKYTRLTNELNNTKSQASDLDKQLANQTSKLNSTQSDFDKYRNLSSASVNELKSEQARLTKELDGAKSNNAALRVQVGSLEGKLAESEKDVANLRGERDKLTTESQRLTAELAQVNNDRARVMSERARVTDELAKTRGALAGVTDDLAKSRGAFAKMGNEKDVLLAELDASKASYASLLGQDNELKAKLIDLRTDKTKADATLARLNGNIAVLNAEIGDLKPQISKLKIDLEGANLRVIDLEKLVFEKINRAKLVVTATAENVPEGFTLELMVSDPWGNDCGPFSAVIFNAGDEIGVLQQSVDFRSGTEGSQKAVFYSMRPVYAGNESGGTYTVRAMIRQNGNETNVRLPHPVTVSCSVDVPNALGTDIHQAAKLEFTYPGYIKKARRGGPLSPSTQYKNMWPWEPVYHFDRILCDFQIRGDHIVNFRTSEQIYANATVVVDPGSVQRAPDEQKIDSIRNRSGN